MTRVSHVALATTLLAVVMNGSGVAVSGTYGPPLIHVTTTDGVVLAAERNGRTLYVRIGSGDVSCNGACSVDWPPFLISPDDFPTDGLTVVHRPDGRRQWSFGNRPLHFFVKDVKRGEANGDGIGRWRALRPVRSDRARQQGDSGRRERAGSPL